MQKPLEAVERPDGLSEVGDFRSQLQTKIPERDEQTLTDRTLAFPETTPAADGRVRRYAVGTHDQSSSARQRA